MGGFPYGIVKLRLRPAQFLGFLLFVKAELPLQQGWGRGVISLATRLASSYGTP
jgi:hypothetical protein